MNVQETPQAKTPVPGSRVALVVGIREYSDSALCRLRLTAAEAAAFAELLKSSEFGGFDQVTLIENQPSHLVWRAMVEFLARRKPEDEALLYFSCHSIRQLGGEVYFAAADTALDLPDASAIRAGEVRRIVDASPARRLVLVLDCCSTATGEPPRSSKQENPTAGLREIFEPRSRALVLTAAESVEYFQEVAMSAANQCLAHSPRLSSKASEPRRRRPTSTRRSPSTKSSTTLTKNCSPPAVRSGL